MSLAVSGIFSTYSMDYIFDYINSGYSSINVSAAHQLLEGWVGWGGGVEHCF